MKPLKHPFVWLICLLLILTGATAAQAATDTPEAQLRNAIDTLTANYTLVINDDQYDVSQLKTLVDFSGVREWSYSGVAQNGQIVLDWTFVWTDDHAVLAAYRDPALAGHLTSRQRTLLRRCQEIMKKFITPDLTDFEKQLAIHDYLVKNCTYDYKTADNRLTEDITPFSAYGALVKKKAVCQGYTEAAYLLLSMAGVESYRLESEDHTWNLVKIDDGYYHMDITWDDTVTTDANTLRYDYMNLTDEQIARYGQHDWFNRDRYPKAEATAYHYFTYYNRVANSEEEIKQLVTQAYQDGLNEVVIWVGNHLTHPYDWTKTLSFISRLPSDGRAIHSYAYIAPGADIDTLTVYFQ